MSKEKTMPLDLTNQEKAAWALLDQVKKADKKLKSYTPQEYEAYLIIERYKANKRKAQATARITALRAKERKKDTHAKILLGSVFLAWVRKSGNFTNNLKNALLEAQKAGVTIDARDMEAMTVAINAADMEREKAEKEAMELKKKEAEKAAKETKKEQVDNAEKSQAIPSQKPQGAMATNQKINVRIATTPQNQTHVRNANSDNRIQAMGNGQ